MKKNKEYIRLLHGKDVYFELILLEALYKSKAGLMMRELVKLLGRERRTIYKYVEQINHYTVPGDQSPSIMMKEDNRYVFIGDKRKYFEIRLTIIENSFTVQFAQELLEKGKVVLYDFEARFHFSESSLRRRIHQANILLEKYNMNLKFHKGNIYLEGEELEIRHAFVSFFWLTYRGMRWPFKLMSQKEVNTSLRALMGEARTAIPQGKKEQLFYIWAVSLSRLRNGNTYSLAEFPEEVEVLSQNHPLFKILKTATPNLPQAEQKGLFAFLLTLPETYLHIEEKTQKELSKIETRLHHLRQAYFVFLKAQHPEWNLDLNTLGHKRFLAVLLSGEMNVLLFKGRSFSVITDGTREYLEDNFPHLLQEMRGFVQNYSSGWQQEDQEQLSLVYARSYSMLFELHDFEPQLNILLATDMPLYVESYIQQTLERFLFSKYKVSIHLQGECTDKHDLILTTCPSSYSNALLPVVAIEAELSQKNLLSIYKICGELIQQRKIQKYQDKGSAHDYCLL